MIKNTLIYIGLFLALVFNKYLIYGECFPSEMGNTENNFPSSISPETISKAIGVSSKVCGIAMKKWPYQDSIYVVYTEDTTEYHIYVLMQSNKMFEVIAQYQSRFGENEYRFRKFDFAPYKIRKNQTAIGIRFFIRGPTMGGGWECEKLVLYEYVNNKINPILSTKMYYLAEGNNVAYDGNTAFYCEEKAIIIIGKPDDSGYNRIIEKIGKKKYVFRYISGSYNTDNLPRCLSKSVSNCFCPSE